MRMRVLLATTAFLFASVGAALAEKWDMPLAYPETNFHTENAKAFAACIKEGTKGAIEIVTHANGSLFKGGEIKRAVQTGQAPIGERLLSAHENENALFGFDAVPFLATSYEQSDKLERAARPYLEKLLDKQNLVLLYTVPWPPQGIYTKKPLKTGADMKGVKFRSYNAATARLAELLARSRSRSRRRSSRKRSPRVWSRASSARVPPAMTSRCGSICAIGTTPRLGFRAIPCS